MGPGRAGDLPEIIASAEPGTTIVLKKGTYRLGARSLQFSKPNVTLRSASNQPGSVVLDGRYRTAEILQIYASRVVIAHLTLKRAVDHPIHISPQNSNDVERVRLYDLRVIDGGEQFVKVNPIDNGAWVDRGRLECSLLRMTGEGRTHVERDPGGCYTGGLDAHSARDWVVRHNTFRNIYCAGEGLAEHAIHFWKGSRGTLVENNTIIGCARGVGFGLGENDGGRKYKDIDVNGYVGHYGGLIRNNVIFAAHPYYDTGIELAQARGAKVHHNTIPLSPKATGFFSSIDRRFSQTRVTIRNNLVERLTVRDGAGGKAHHNLEGTPLSYFAAPGRGDFHLKSSATKAIDDGATFRGQGLDIDGQSHDRGRPDLGGDERRPGAYR